MYGTVCISAVYSVGTCAVYVYLLYTLCAHVQYTYLGMYVCPHSAPGCSLFAVCAVEKREDLHKLILSSLDFSWDGCARAILNRLLTGGTNQMRLYATKYLRVFLRSRSPVFKSWGMEVLTTQVGGAGGGGEEGEWGEDEGREGRK